MKERMNYWECLDNVQTSTPSLKFEGVARHLPSIVKAGIMTIIGVAHPHPNPLDYSRQELLDHENRE